MANVIHLNTEFWQLTTPSEPILSVCL